MVLVVELLVTKDLLDKILAVIKSTSDRDGVNIGVKDRGHLSLLDGGNSAVGVKNKNRDVLLVAKTVDGGGTGITGSGTDDSNDVTVSGVFSLTGIASSEEVFKEVSDELQGNVLERIGRTVEQLKQVKTQILIQGSERGDILSTESGVGLFNKSLKVGSGDLVIGDVKRQNVECQLLEAEILPLLEEVLRQVRDLGGDVKASIGSKTLNDGLLKGEVGLSR